MKRIHIVCLVVITGLLQMGCEADSTNCDSTIDTSGIEISVDVKRLEIELFEQESREDILKFFRRYPAFTNYFIDSHQYPSDTILAQRTLNLINDKHVRDTLLAETMKTFGDLDELKNQFTLAFKRIKYFYPDFQAPKIQTAVTGFYKDLLMSDTLIIVGLDHYIGRAGTYKPRDIPQYILDRYEPENVVPMIVYFLSDRFNRVDLSNETLLNEMIDFGKAYYFTKTMVPCSTDAQIVGYSDQVLADVLANQEIIWANFIQNELIYEKNHEVKVKFIGERPKIPEIGPKCPGRIAAWLGYEIVKSYMDNNPDITLNALMANRNTTEIFMQSGYVARNR